MTESQFIDQVAALRRLTYREDFQTALYDLYIASTPTHCEALRKAMASGNLKSPPQWKNPADYDRSDLTREQNMRQFLIGMSVKESSRDYRDDLCAIAYCYHNLKLTGVDADVLLRELATRSGPKFAELLKGFLKHSSKSPLSDWNLVAVQTPSGLVAERTG